MDAFAPPTITPHQVEEGGPKLPTTPKPPKPIPELDRLFAVQNDANKALHALREFQDKHRDLTKETLALERHIENTYRVINRYLRDYASGGNL